MNFIASKGQLRASFLRWALFTVPLILLLGYISGASGGPDTSWFANLAKPSIYPEPKWFEIVWTILYIMIGIAVALVCSAWGAYGRKFALLLFIFHFLFNLAWMPVFFGMQDIEMGLYVIIGAVITLLPALYGFWKIRWIAGALLVPYLAWLLFAALLNYEFLQLNPDGGHSILLEPAQSYEI